MVGVSVLGAALTFKPDAKYNKRKARNAL